MFPLILETAQIMDPIAAPTSAGGTNITINGIPATIGYESMHLHPIFDWSPISLAGGAITLPLWIFITAGFMLLLAWVIMSWIFKLRRMSSVRGYVTAAGKGTQEDMQVWIFGKTKKLTIECLKYWGGMIHYPLNVKISKWRHPSIMSTMNVGGVPAVAVSDDFDQTRDMVSEIALCSAGEWFNNNLENNRLKAKQAGIDPDLIQPISCFSDYENYGRKMLESIFPDGLWIDSWSIFYHTKFRKFFPKGRDSDLSGGVFIRKSRKLKPKSKDAGILAKLLPIGLCILFVGILIFGAMYVPLGA